MSITDLLVSKASIVRLAPAPADRHIMSYCLLSDGTLGMVTTDVDLNEEWQRILTLETPIDPGNRWRSLLEDITATVLIWHEAGWSDELSFSLQWPHLKADRFADGRWLIVGGRTDDDTPNARVLSSEGVLLSRFRLGDGIEHIRIDPAGRIWVGWFDEGVGGSHNEDWRVPGSERPPTDEGVGCFDDTGKYIKSEPMPDVGWIMDCYALTPTADGAWACPYTDFPLLHLSPGTATRWWRNDIAGAKAIAVEGRYAMLAGGYREDANRLAVVALGGQGGGEPVSIVTTWALPLRPMPPSENDWSPVWERPALLSGHGNMLHLVDRGVWYRWQVRDLVPA